MTYKINILLLIMLITTMGCSAPTPWVKPYEREILADPIMSFSRDPLMDKHTAHVNEIREGSRGGTAVSGGGCGCN